MSWKLYEGDCLDVMRGMESESVDLIITSPPYNLGKNHHKRMNNLQQTIFTMGVE